MKIKDVRFEILKAATLPVVEAELQIGQSSDEGISVSVLGRRFRSSHVPEGLNRQQQRCENLRFHVSALIHQTTRRHITEESNLMFFLPCIIV